MDRFQEETAADLARNYARSLYGDDYEPYVEPLECGSCGHQVDSVTRCTWDARLMVGHCCEAPEPDEIPVLRPIAVKVQIPSWMKQEVA